MNWRQIVHRLCRELHYTPEQVGRMTLYQVRMICAEEEDLADVRVRKISHDELLMMKGK